MVISFGIKPNVTLVKFYYFYNSLMPVVNYPQHTTKQEFVI
jgi:hypothetical protein